VYVVPIVPSTPKFMKVATPEDAVAVVVPTNVPPALTVAVTTAEDEVTVLLLES
jgi:hypothetical protein